ncbi:INF2-like protein [Mya arenaria]|uniref:INF2-like protein n=1 Tax=Mya arenaria TaxID=6604 RepID=A0ABY7DLY9_MYAAR|nr:INF2-like protein [Mya arenaria]
MLVFPTAPSPTMTHFTSLSFRFALSRSGIPILDAVMQVSKPADVNNTTLELQQDLARSTPTQCVTLTHSVPSEYLELNGLDSLLDSLDQMTGRSGFTCFSDAILQIDCISCIRSVLNSSVGMEYFINNDIYTKKLTMALNCSDTLPKKQVIEMLSTICVYNNIGYLRVLEGLAHVKSECDQLHRFSVVVRDLQKSETVAYKTAIMTFINTLINCTPDITERIRIRNEFIGLDLLEMLSYIRKEEPDEDLLLQLEVFHERKMSDEEGVFGTTRMVNFVNILQDLLAVETVYSEHSSKLWQTLDELLHHVVHTVSERNLDNLQSELCQLPEHLHLGLQCVSSYQATVDASSTGSKIASADSTNPNILRKMFSGSKLKQASNRKPLKETDIHEMKGIDDANGLSQADKHSTEKNSDMFVSKLCVNLQGYNSSESSQNKTLTSTGNNSTMMARSNIPFIDTTTGDKTVVQPPQLFSPSDLTFFSNQMDGTNSPDTHEATNNCSKSLSNQSAESNTSPHTNNCSNSISSKLSKLSAGNQTSKVPTPEISKPQMNINVPEVKDFVYDQNNKLGNICLPEVLESLSNMKKEKLDSSSFCKDLLTRKQNNQIERQMCQAPGKPLCTLKWVILDDERIAGREPCVWLPPLIDGEKITVDYKKLENTFQVISLRATEAIEEVVLLDASTRLKINLFLSRLDCGAEDLVHTLDTGSPTQLTLPMVQYLHNILPQHEEIEMLRHYIGPRLELGMAEQFILLLSDIPDYTILLDGHLMRAEFDVMTRKVKEELTTMIDMAKLVLGSKEMKQVLHYVLAVGNYLNYGKFHGDAAGYKLTTLSRLGEVRASSAGRTLLHHIIQVTVEENRNRLTFVKQGDISKLNGKLRYFMSHLSKASSKLQDKFQAFIETVKGEFGCIRQLTTELHILTDQLANYFCEEEATFNMQETFQALLHFCKQLRQAHSEAPVSSKTELAIQTKRSTDVLQKKLKSKLISLEFGQNAGASSSMIEGGCNKLTERILNQLHKGNFQPSVRSEMPSPEPPGPTHPLEMSCIPYIGSPTQQGRPRLGTGTSDNVFLDTPELVCPTKLTRSSTQKLRPIVTTCTAQTKSTSATLGQFPPSPITGNKEHAGKKSATLHRKLFPLETEEYQEREIISEEEKQRQNAKVKRQLELPSRNPGHRRSRSDMVDSMCVMDKWIEYEKNRDVDAPGAIQAPIAEPESICNLSTLNLENKGKFISNKDVQALKVGNDKNGAVCMVEDGPVLKVPIDRYAKQEKKSSVGGFFSKLGRAVLKPRNVYSDGDQYQEPAGKGLKERKKSFSSDKENVNMEPMPTEGNFGLRDSKRYKSEGNSNKVSRFFQRGGLYRSSKMKKKNQGSVKE